MLLYVGWVALMCSFLFTCSIRLVNHGLYYSSPGINEPGVERKKERRDTTHVKSLCIHDTGGFITSSHKDKTALHDLMATLATESLREALATKQQQTKEQL